MPEITVQQAWDAVDYDKNEQSDNASTATVYYIVGESEDESAVIAAVAENAPETFEDIPRQSIAISERLTQTDWKVEVKYAFGQDGSGGGGGADGNTEDADPQYNFEVSSGSRRVVYSIETKGTYPDLDVEHQAGINDGEGVDVIMPVSKFSETHFFSGSKITEGYKIIVSTLVGKINQSTFRGYGPGEVLFTGCTGSRTGNSSADKWQVTYNFSVAHAQYDIRIGNITNISKGPWDIIWCRYKEVENKAKTETLKAVKAVFVEQVYEEADFNDLGI